MEDAKSVYVFGVRQGVSGEDVLRAMGCDGKQLRGWTCEDEPTLVSFHLQLFSYKDTARVLSSIPTLVSVLCEQCGYPDRKPLILHRAYNRSWPASMGLWKPEFGDPKLKYTGKANIQNLFARVRGVAPAVVEEPTDEPTQSSSTPSMVKLQIPEPKVKDEGNAGLSEDEDKEVVMGKVQVKKEDKADAMGRVKKEDEMDVVMSKVKKEEEKDVMMRKVKKEGDKHGVVGKVEYEN